jgi:cyclophilin family peptidyl-prolyl cis-trans isomerase
MYDLIKTTYERNFNKEIIEKYLKSPLDNDVKAALLSISQSEDTSFIPDILKLDLNRFGKQIFFTIGQIGECDQSKIFLWNYILSSQNNPNPEAYFALGKIGNKKDLSELISYYNRSDNSKFIVDGISEAFSQFQNRGIREERAKKILLDLALSDSSVSGKLIALFALARYNDTLFVKNNLSKFLLSNYSKNDTIFNTDLNQLVLMNITKTINLDFDNILKSFGSDIEKFSFELNLIKVLNFIYFNASEYPKKNIDLYFHFINDKNENIAIQASISIKRLKGLIPDSLLSPIKNKISLTFSDTKIPPIVRGELFLSSLELFNDFEHHKILLNSLDLPKKYVIAFLAKNPDKEKALNDLADIFFMSANLNNKIDALTEIFNIKGIDVTSKHYFQIVSDALTSTQAPLNSISADGIDSVFISSHISELKNIISEKLKIYKDDPDFLESLMSFINLSSKIDSEFYEQSISLLSHSKLFSVRKFLSAKSSSIKLGQKELSMFDDIWANAFKYSEAIINTTKGNFTIKFNSEIAPISVGNFCMLAKRGFYNGIVFHRVVPGFVIQAGDPTSSGWGGPGYDIVSEFSDKSFNIGAVGMASAGKDTEGSQFFVMQGFYPHLNSRYTWFAQVADGLNVITKITQSDKIISIDLIK